MTDTTPRPLDTTMVSLSLRYPYQHAGVDYEAGETIEIYKYKADRLREHWRKRDAEKSEHAAKALESAKAGGSA